MRLPDKQDARPGFLLAEELFALLLQSRVPAIASHEVSEGPRSRRLYPCIHQTHLLLACTIGGEVS